MMQNNVSPSHDNAAYDNSGEVATAATITTKTATAATVITATSSKEKSPQAENGHVKSASAKGPEVDSAGGAAAKNKNCEWLGVQVIANEGG